MSSKNKFLMIDLKIRRGKKGMRKRKRQKWRERKKKQKDEFYEI